MDIDKTIYYCPMCHDTYDDRINKSKCKGKIGEEECPNTCCSTCEYCTFQCQKNIRCITYEIGLLKSQIKELEELLNEIKSKPNIS